MNALSDLDFHCYVQRLSLHPLDSGLSPVFLNCVLCPGPPCGPLPPLIVMPGTWTENRRSELPQGLDWLKYCEMQLYKRNINYKKRHTILISCGKMHQAALKSFYALTVIDGDDSLNPGIVGLRSKWGQPGHCGIPSRCACKTDSN